MLKDFSVLRKLGEGSFGQVFQVRRNTDGQEYAMKKVRLGNMKEKERENAVNEVRILASLSDEFVIGYKDSFYDAASECLCVVMEFAEGGDILKKVGEHKRARTHFSEKEVWKALSCMARGLKGLHDKSILHRDLKCANVFITKDGLYKLGDLNVSKVLKKGLAHTQTGTPYYASPQVWRDEPYDGRSDMWSLGCVIYEMCALKPPFEALDLRGLYKKIQSGVFERIPTQYSQQLQVVISMLLKVNASLRPNADQLLANSIVVKNTGHEESTEDKPNQKLLQTIRFSPRDLKSLQAKLPKANYETVKEEQEPDRPPSVRKERANSAQGSRITNLSPDKRLPVPPVPPSPSPSPAPLAPSPKGAPTPPPMAYGRPPAIPSYRPPSTPSKPPLPLNQPIIMQQRCPSPSKPIDRPRSREREPTKRPSVAEDDALYSLIRQYENIRLRKEGKPEGLARQPSKQRLRENSQERGDQLRQASRQVVRLQRAQSNQNIGSRRPMSAQRVQPSWWG